MLKLGVTFAAFFISLGRILWVSDDRCPKTWAASASNSLQLLLHWQCTTALTQSSWWSTSGAHQTPHVSKCLRKENPRSRSRSSRGEPQAVTRRREGQESRGSSGCRERCSLAGDTQCILQNLWICSFLHVQTKITALRMVSPCLHVKQSNQTIPSPFSLPPHLHALLQTDGHELGWQLLRRRGKVLYSECSITSKTCYFTVTGNS